MTTGALNSGQGALVCPVMVGRGPELEVLRQAWHGAGRMLMVRGPAGIGKSRLVREFGTEVTDAGGDCPHRPVQPDRGDVPLRPLREALLAAARRGLVHPGT